MNIKTNLRKLALLTSIMATVPSAHAFFGVVFDPTNWMQNTASAVAAVKNEVNTYHALIEQANTAMHMARSTSSLKNLASLAGVQEVAKLYTALRDVDNQLGLTLERNQALTQNTIAQYGASNQSWQQFLSAKSSIAADERRATTERFRAVNASLQDTAQRREQIVGQLASVQGQTEAMQALGASLDVLIGQNQQIIMAMQASAIAAENRAQEPEQLKAKTDEMMRQYQQRMRDAASKY